jgi:hypothetical protein
MGSTVSWIWMTKAWIILSCVQMSLPYPYVQSLALLSLLYSRCFYELQQLSLVCIPLSFLKISILSQKISETQP